MADVVVIDSGGANIASLLFAMQRLGASAELTVDPARIDDFMETQGAAWGAR